MQPAAWKSYGCKSACSISRSCVYDDRGRRICQRAARRRHGALNAADWQDLCRADRLRIWRSPRAASGAFPPSKASVYRFVGPKRIERIAGVYEAGVAAVA